MTRRYPLGDVKILWALAAGRCCFPGCRDVCIVAATTYDRTAALGDIAHIVAHSPTGPRADAAFPKDALDTYENWVLLCPTHHRLVDAQANSYTAATLRHWKATHEAWVADQLREPEQGVVPVRSRQENLLYRIAIQGSDPWTPVPRAQGLDTGRWADPLDRYNVVYAADSPASAIAEVLAPYRQDAGIIEEMSRFLAVARDEPSSLPVSTGPSVRDLLGNKDVAEATVVGAFADMEDPAIRRFVDERLESLIGRRPDAMSPLGDIRWTREASRILVEAGHWDGMQYRSRTAPESRLYALFPSAKIAPQQRWPAVDH